MRTTTFAPAYVALYPALSELAHCRGYALCVHGSIISDFDLIAIPWTVDAEQPEALVNALAERLKLCLGTFGTGRDEKPEIKPHGRKTWNLYIGSGAKIDLSVMPLMGSNVELRG